MQYFGNGCLDPLMGIGNNAGADRACARASSRRSRAAMVPEHFITAARRWASFRAASRKAAVDLKIRPIALPERPRQSATVRPRLSGKSWALGHALPEFSK